MQAAAGGSTPSPSGRFRYAAQAISQGWIRLVHECKRRLRRGFRLPHHPLPSLFLHTPKFTHLLPERTAHMEYISAPWRILVLRFGCLSAFVLVAPLLAQIGPIDDLQEDLPVRLTDTSTSNGPQFQQNVTYIRTHDTRNQFLTAPQLQFGFSNRWQAQVSILGIAGADNTGNGDVSASLLLRLNEERSLLPSFAIQGQIDAPTGKDSAGLDTRIQFIASKAVSGGPHRGRVHFNGAWYRDSGIRPGERSDRPELAFGYSRVLVPYRVALVLAFTRRAETEEGKVMNLPQAGIRWSVNPALIISAGVTVGVGAQSDKFRATAGLEYSF